MCYALYFILLVIFYLATNLEGGKLTLCWAQLLWIQPQVKGTLFRQSNKI